jgi:tRNA uridine 5-carbamoylmethylation protein Kti12
MLELVINRGVPGSGKTTVARKWVFEGTPRNRRVRVNRDDIRMQLYGVEFGVPIEETVVTAVQHATIRALLERGVSVIVDDCNIAQKYITTFTKIAGEFSADVRVNFVDVSLGTALERNRKRKAEGGRFVPENVIVDMYNNLHGVS